MPSAEVACSNDISAAICAAPANVRQVALRNAYMQGYGPHVDFYFDRDRRQTMVRGPPRTINRLAGLGV